MFMSVSTKYTISRRFFQTLYARPTALEHPKQTLSGCSHRRYNGANVCLSVIILHFRFTLRILKYLCNMRVKTADGDTQHCALY
jgi:hypothetical protein